MPGDDEEEKAKQKRRTSTAGDLASVESRRLQEIADEMAKRPPVPEKPKDGE